MARLLRSEIERNNLQEPDNHYKTTRGGGYEAVERAQGEREKATSLNQLSA